MHIQSTSSVMYAINPNEVFEHNGKSLTLRQWAFQLGWAPASLYRKIRKQGASAALSKRATSRSTAGSRGAKASPWGSRMV